MTSVSFPHLQLRYMRVSRVLPLALLVLACVVATCLCLIAPNALYNVANDPLGQMIVTENLLHHHSLSLNNLNPDVLTRLTYHVVPHSNGRLYYYFPFGTTLMVAPVVAVLDAFGWDMVRDEAAAEAVTCALAAPLIILMLFSIARRFVPQVPAVVLAFLMWAGSSFASVGGLAPWAHLTSTAFATLSILLVLQDSRVRSPWLRSALGATLFMAYLSRPTLALLAPMMLLFIACRSWRSAVWVGLVVAGFLAVFFTMNLYVFGEARPLFYAGDRLGTDTYWLGVYGNLLGASRGLFVFSPFLLIPFLFISRIWSTAHRPLLILALGWPLLHLLVISDFPRWWAGYSYGPRYTMEALPGLFLLLCLAWQHARTLPLAVPTASALAFLGAFAIFAHTFEGMFNPAAQLWNGAVLTDEHPELALDWRWPQWAATEARNAQLAAYRMGR